MEFIGVIIQGGAVGLCVLVVLLWYKSSTEYRKSAEATQKILSEVLQKNATAMATNASATAEHTVAVRELRGAIYSLNGKGQENAK